MKRGMFKLKYCLVFLFIIVIILFPILVLKFEFFKSKTCGDETGNNSCSDNKPYFCEEGILIEKASVCGCPEILKKEGDSCISEYQTNSKNISLIYLLDDKIGNIEFTVYRGIYDYVSGIPRHINYYGNEERSRRDFKLKALDDSEQRNALMPLVIGIQNSVKKKEEQAKIAISLIQIISYNDSLVDSDLEQAVNYKYPYQTIYDEQALCSEKADLLAFLLRELGYGVAIFYFPVEDHEAVGIKCSARDFQDTGYCFIETTGLVGERG
ncbi:MAG: hypothetical protein ABIE36_00980, partial [Candidatus Diapherotrites archaeon]